MKITSAQLKEHFEANNKFIIAKNKVELTWEDTGEINVTLPIEAGQSRGSLIRPDVIGTPSRPHLSAIRLTSSP
ncbi:MAG: hypothetical protein ABI675_21770 [Chitinophagaceae bacterium]